MLASSKKRRPSADTLSTSSTTTTTTTTTTTSASTTSSDKSDQSSYSYYSSGSSSVTARAAAASRGGSSQKGKAKARESASSSFDLTSIPSTTTVSSSAGKTSRTVEADAASSSASTAAQGAEGQQSSSSSGSSADKLMPSLPLQLSRRLSRTGEPPAAEGEPGAAMLPLDVVRRDPVLSKGALVPIYGPPPKHHPDVIAKIRTTVLPLPPTDAMLEQRRKDGCMPYPSRLTYRMVARPNVVGDGIPVGGQQLQEVDAAEEDQAKLRARHEKADASCSCCSMGSKRFWRKRNIIEDRNAARQHINKTVMRGHHVPLVPFATRRQDDQDRAAAPTVEEARQIIEHGVTQTPGTGDAIALAMGKSHSRPSNVFVIKTAHSMGGETVRHCARSKFLAPDEPAAFWMTQLQERPQLLLGEIDESEVFSIASEVSRLSEGDRLLEESEQLQRLEHRIQHEQARIEEEQHLATSMADAAGDLVTVPSGNVHYYVDPVYGTKYDPNKKTSSGMGGSVRSSATSSDAGDPAVEASVRQARETKRRLRSISPPHVAPDTNAHSPFGFSS